MTLPPGDELAHLPSMSSYAEVRESVTDPRMHAPPKTIVFGRSSGWNRCNLPPMTTKMAASEEETMKSSVQMPDTPWPSEMLITVDERPLSLLELLWVREAYELDPRGDDLPPLLANTPRTATGAAIEAEERERWEHAWPQVWRAAVAHAGVSQGEQVWIDLASSADGSAERDDLLHRITGPRWRDRFGDQAFTSDLHRAWLRRADATASTSVARRLEDHPERRDLEALIGAWRVGLRRVVTIPCSTNFARKIGESALLLSAETRHSSDRYRRALSAFG